MISIKNLPFIFDQIIITEYSILYASSKRLKNIYSFNKLNNVIKIKNKNCVFYYFSSIHFKIESIFSSKQLFSK